MSFLGKKWVIQNKEEDLDIVSKLHVNRDLDSEEKQKVFFEGDLGHLHDPLLFKDMKKASERIQKAVSEKEKIMIFGDYDVDGITSTVIMYDFLKRVGADVYHTIPNREDDGYGLKDYFIKQFKEEGINLIVTVDCGVANVNEINLANELGIDVVITDHHDTPDKMPKAYAIVDPKQPDCQYPNKHLSGSGVAYKLVRVLAPYYFEEPEDVNEYLNSLLGMATLGLVADCMPLTGENRILTKYGLKSLENGNNPGIRALMESAGVSNQKITSTTIGFYLGPRINAAGRLDSANHAFELLLGDAEKVQTLTKLNSERQKIVEQFVNQAKKQVKELGEIPNLIVISNREWRVGTLGLISGKICDYFKRPAIAMQERDNEYVASCRSLADFDITAFLRKEAFELFSAFGGHKLAGGFTLPKKNLAELQSRINNAAESIETNDFQDALEIDAEISPEELSFDTCGHIDRLEPFGNGNPEPTLIIRDIKIENVKPVGKRGEHLQFPVKYGEKNAQAIAFRFGQHLDKIDQDKTYDIAFNLEVNEWKGYRKLQLRVVDLKQSN